MATRKNRLQLLHGGLKRVQERGTRYKVADDLRISEPSLGDGACNMLGIFAPSLDSRASIHKWPAAKSSTGKASGLRQKLVDAV